VKSFSSHFSFYTGLYHCTCTNTSKHCKVCRESNIYE